MKFMKQIALMLVLMLATLRPFRLCQRARARRVVSDPTSSIVEPEQKADISVIAISGPTGMGMVKLMKDNDEGKAANNYTFSLTSTPSDVVGKITNNEVDIAAIPANLAATLYAKTEGQNSDFGNQYAEQSVHRTNR